MVVWRFYRARGWYGAIRMAQMLMAQMKLGGGSFSWSCGVHASRSGLCLLVIALVVRNREGARLEGEISFKATSVTGAETRLGISIAK